MSQLAAKHKKAAFQHPADDKQDWKLQQSRPHKKHFPFLFVRSVHSAFLFICWYKQDSSLLSACVSRCALNKTNSPLLGSAIPQASVLKHFLIAYTPEDEGPFYNLVKGSGSSICKSHDCLLAIRPNHIFYRCPFLYILSVYCRSAWQGIKSSSREEYLQLLDWQAINSSNFVDITGGPKEAPYNDLLGDFKWSN